MTELRDSKEKNNSWQLILLLGFPAMVLMVLDIKKADQYEIEKFGDVYRDYMKRVPQINFIKGILRQIQHRQIKT